MASTSIARKIKYTHVPKDGKDGRTPIYNANLKTWQYDIAPSSQQMEFSIERLKQVDTAAFDASAKAGDAFSKAQSAHTLATTVQGEASMAQSTANAAQSTASSAQSAAITAQQTADAKATPEEAVEEVRTQMFEVYDQNGSKLIAESFQLQELDGGWIMMFCARRPSLVSGSGGSPFCLHLAYANSADLASLEERVSAIEQRLGI